MTSLNHEALLRELDARRQISDVLARVARGVDRLDRDLIISGYHPDAIDYHGSFEGSPSEFADWVVERHSGTIEQCMHFLGQSNLRIEGDRAACESNVVVYYRMDKDGISQDMVSPGRYLDRFECRDGEWKITERLAMHEKDRFDPVVFKMQGPFVDLLSKARRDSLDPSYAFFAGEPMPSTRPQG